MNLELIDKHREINVNYDGVNELDKENEDVE